MGALENITERIRADALKKAEQRINEAEKEGKELLLKAQKEIEREKKAIELETEKAIKIQRSRAISEAKLEARKAKLSAKEEVIAQAFEIANERFKRLSHDENERYLRNAIKNALNLLGREVDVLCNRSDFELVSRIASELDPRIGISWEGIEYIGGAVIRAKNGSAQIDATFEGMLERLRNDIRKEVAEILFKAE